MVLGMRGYNTLPVNIDQVAVVRKTRGAACQPCEHPAWRPVWHVDGNRILAYVCNDCVATRPPGDVTR